MNVANQGKSPIKRMRARIRFLPLTTRREPITRRARPDGFSEEEWRARLRFQEEFEARIQKEMDESQYGRPLPFSSRTPRGTIGRPWVEADNRVSYEVDLSPRSDEASVELISIVPLDEIALTDLEKQGIMKFDRPPNVPFPNIRALAITVGNNSGLMINPSGQGLLYDLALKFWIVSENMTEDVAQIFHVEIPNALDAIICTKLKKGSKQYKQFEKMFSA
jgi:hypothetical protein